MSQPTPYERLYNLVQYATDNPANPYNPAQHDAELDAVEENLDGLNANIALLQRDDGRLANASVHPNALDSATRLLFANWNIRGNWVAFTDYAVRDFVDHGGLGYVAMAAHTSNDFTIDLAAGRWLQVDVNMAALSASSGSSLVGFSQSGAVAPKSVASLVQTKIRNGVPIDLVSDYGAALEGDITEKLNDAISDMSNYSVPANPTAGGTKSLPCGGTILLPDGQYAISGAGVTVNPYISIVSKHRWLMGQAEAGYFGVSIFNNVAGNPAFKLKAGAGIRGMRFLKEAGSADEHIRIVAEFCSVTHCALDAALKHIAMVAETVNIDPVYAYIAYNQLFHLHHATNGSLSFSGLNAGGGSVIEFNDWNTHAALGYLGTVAIKGDGVNVVGGLKIRNNIFQNFAVAANSAVVDLSNNANSYVTANSWGGALGATQDCIKVGGGGGHTVKGNAFAGTANRGVHLTATCTGSEIGVNDYSGGVTTAVLIDNGASRNHVNEPANGLTITNNSTANNTVITFDRHAMGNDYYLRGQGPASAVALALIGMDTGGNVAIAADGTRTKIFGRTVMNAKSFTLARSPLVYSAAMTPVADNGNIFEITATNATAFTINAPSGNLELGQRITLKIANTSGGALGVVTWGATYKMSAWTSPATGFNRSIDFYYDGANLIQIGQTGVDVPN